MMRRYGSLLLPIWMACAIALLSAVTGCTMFGQTHDAEKDHSSRRSQLNQEMVETFERKRDVAQYQAALSRWQEGDTAECKALIEQLIERNPQYIEARILYLELLLEQGEADKALTGITAIAQEHPKVASLQHLLALALEATGKHEAALDHFRIAADKEPDNQVFLASYQTALETSSAQSQQQPK